jgi:hypothetical protein
MEDMHVEVLAKELEDEQRKINTYFKELLASRPK